LSLNNLLGAVITLDLFDHDRMAKQVFGSIFQKLVSPHVSIHIKLKAVWHLVSTGRFTLCLQFIKAHPKSHPALKNIGDLLYEFLKKNEKMKTTNAEKYKRICLFITDVYTKYLYYGEMEDCYETLVGDIVVFRRLTELYCYSIQSLDDNPTTYLKAAEIADLLVVSWSDSKKSMNSIIFFNDLLLVCTIYKELLTKGKLFGTNELDKLKNKTISYLRKTQKLAKQLKQTELENILSNISTKLEKVDILGDNALDFLRNDHERLETTIN